MTLLESLRTGLTRNRVPVFMVALVVFAFWRALLAGGTLVSHDFAATVAPFETYQSDGFTLEGGAGDPILSHAHWDSMASDLRSGDIGWWDRDLALGQPTMKGGLAPYSLVYVAVPGWFAPGLIAALRTLVAMGLMFGFLRSVLLRRSAALLGAVAFGFSGFLIGWLNFPQATVASLAPGLLWAVERTIRAPARWRAVPLAVVVAAMVWSNFPQVTVYVVLAAALYAVVRLGSERLEPDPGARGRLVPLAICLALAAGLCVLLSAPHLIGFSEYFSWGDTTYRDTGVADSSAGIAYLATSVLPWIFGSEAGGPAWFGEGNWIEFQNHLGASVVVMAVLGALGGLRHQVPRVRAVSLAAGLITAIGVLVAYIGGPAGVLLGDVVGDAGGLMTRAKVLIALGASVLAAVGVDVWLADELTTRRRRSLALQAAGVIVAAAGVIAFAMNGWADDAAALGIRRELFARSIVPLMAGAVTVGLLYARSRNWIGSALAGAALVLVVSFEVLSFAMPVPTTVDRSERLEETPAHVAVRDLLEPGEVLAGEGGSFFPGTTAQFEISDARGQTLKSRGYQELLRAVDPHMFEVVGATPTNPQILTGTDPTLPVWDTLGVGVWATNPRSAVLGRRIDPEGVVGLSDPAAQPLTGRVVIGDEGARAVVLELIVSAPADLRVEISGADGGAVATLERTVGPADSGWLTVPFEEDSVVPGEELAVRVSSAPDIGSVSIGVDGLGAAGVGMIQGGDGLRIVRVGDVVLYERETAAFARLFDAAVVAADPADAAALVAARGDLAVGVVDEPVALPATADPSAEMSVVDVSVTADTTFVSVVTDRPALLVVAQAQYPGWSVTVDGEPASIRRADAFVTGVVVPAGEHDVRFVFRPRNLSAMVALLGVGLIGCVALSAPAVRRVRIR